ncbi:pyrimidine 5'-nucleotidase [Falsigemmobacter faecalis]|uniref:Pyrimidine 5'-nucleotidase n=1 Tax=Falsigemmobacter faecalis TaxID=2488730 RepID=A0A3P3D7I8_9RHOB|nr:pyrimidine 5'-nucleotidase [Falsigemmobacter faecalis]RRH69412.1 pyrimidine 5'-nucleotidase [Falsigemmobacter faecalis]
MEHAADPQPAFRHVSTWVFDLDNTLYDPSVRLFDQIEGKMVDYVMRTLKVERDTANRLRREFYLTYGTTLAGLMEKHGVEADPFLEDVHDIDLSALTPDPLLSARIAALPGRRIVYTNATVPYARAVLEARGMTPLFDAVYGVQEADYHPKPRREAFERIFSLDAVVTRQAAMFEDDPRNLAVPHEMGMQTVLVGPEPVKAPHIGHHSLDLSSFLGRLTGL